MHLGLFFFWAWRTGFFTQNSQLTSEAHQQARISGSLWAQASPGLFPGAPPPLALFPSGWACDPTPGALYLKWVGNFQVRNSLAPSPAPSK